MPDKQKKGGKSQQVQKGLKDRKGIPIEGNLAGEPGRTPGAAEGDRDTIEQDLRSKSGKGSTGSKRRK